MFSTIRVPGSSGELVFLMLIGIALGSIFTALAKGQIISKAPNAKVIMHEAKAMLQEIPKEAAKFTKI